MSLTLLVLAAGMGSRYGGLKQLDPLGPSGETLLDYAVFDAVRAGFDRVVFVIRSEFEAQFREQVLGRYAGRIAVTCVHQNLDDLPPGHSVPAGRIKPWGTGQAVWCARREIVGPFMVIGADDFFGADAFTHLAEFLKRPGEGQSGPARFALVGYRLDRTLSEHGTVSRGICRLDAEGRLAGIDERTDLSPARLAELGLRGDETVSMNCFGFTPFLFPALDLAFDAFLRASGSSERAEFYLPSAVSDLIAHGEATVDVLPSADRWFGMTNRDDRPRVVAALAERVQRGDYPSPLF